MIAAALNENTKKMLRLGLTLFTVTAVTGLILGLVQWGTADAIRATQEHEKALALSAVLSEADKFTAVPVVSGADPMVVGVEKGTKGDRTVGYCVTVAPKGYGGVIKMVVGVTPDGVLQGLRILDQSETPGLGAKAADVAFWGQFQDKHSHPLTVVKQPATAETDIQAISGATITSRAVVLGANTAVNYWQANLKGVQ